MTSNNYAEVCQMTFDFETSVSVAHRKLGELGFCVQWIYIEAHLVGL